MGSYQRPESLSEALRALGRAPATVLAGGTDYYPSRVGRAPDDDLLDITAVSELGTLADEGDWIRIGALVRWRDLARADLPSSFDGLRAAARQIGGAQVQNAGTICGNVCNASPAADAIPNLLVLDAEVELASLDGVRRLTVDAFVTGNRTTSRRPAELVTALLVPKYPECARSGFFKLGTRAFLVISIVMVAGLLVPAGDGSIAVARLSVGSCSPVARRLPMLEAALRGQPLGAGLSEILAPEHLDPLSPIDDVRGTAAYRRDAAMTLLRRCLDQLGGSGP